MSVKLSIIVISYNMAREVPRTIESLLPPYQQNVHLRDYEILVMENGSSVAIDPIIIQSWPENVKYVAVKDPQPSPASALNMGMSMASGEYICSMIDGARMASPGLIGQTLKAINLSSKPTIATIGLHLGPKRQQESTLEGYDQTAEDALLASIDWRKNGYRLFEISSYADSAPHGWLGPISESNAITVSRAAYEQLGGFDPKFSIPGGGLVNLDFFKRAIRLPRSEYILLLGEATFHQVHGGVTTSKSVGTRLSDETEKTTWDLYAEQYRSVRGIDYTVPKMDPILFGKAPKAAQKLFLAGVLNQYDLHTESHT